MYEHKHTILYLIAKNLNIHCGLTRVGIVSAELASDTLLWGVTIVYNITITPTGFSHTIAVHISAHTAWVAKESTVC
jgi:hypothetical protein